MKFKVGDRIRIYGTDRNFNPIHGDTTITGFTDNGSFYIEENESVVKKGHYDLTLPHPRQCRKLRKVEPPRRIWVPNPTAAYWKTEEKLNEVLDTPNQLMSYLEIETQGSDAFIEFVEVRRGKSK